MNANRLDAYVFALREHWARCLQWGFLPAAAGGLTQPAPLGLNARRVSADGPATCIAAGGNGVLAWRVEPECAPVVLERSDENGCEHYPLEIGGVLARSPRWLLERDAFWAFCTAAHAIARYDRHTLEADFTRDAAVLLPDSEAPPPARPTLRDIAAAPGCCCARTTRVRACCTSIAKGAAAIRSTFRTARTRCARSRASRAAPRSRSSTRPARRSGSCRPMPPRKPKRANMTCSSGSTAGPRCT
jgi:hypothetical protein